MECSEMRQSRARLKNSTKRDKITKRITIRLTIPVYDQLLKKAQKKNKPVSRYVHDLIEQHANR
jgi:macrodomain Ter protein organizer (MatP/YcbG family)